MSTEITKYGTALEMMMYAGFMGETSRISIVPVSFSFTMAMAVIMTQTISSTIAITPGTKFGAPFSCGL